MKTKIVSVLFYDGRVARCFADCKDCIAYMRKRVAYGEDYYTITFKSPTRIEYTDETGQAHAYWWTDYEVE